MIDNLVNKPEARLTAALVGTVGCSLDLSKQIIGRDSIPPLLADHIGNFSIVFTPVFLAGFVGRGVELVGERYNLPYLESFGRYLPEATTSLLLTYVTLGETVAQQIYPGTADPSDVPAAIVAAGAGYLFGKLK